MSFLIPDINTFFLLHTHFFSLLVYHVPILSCNPTVYTLCTVSTWGSVYIRKKKRRLRHQCSCNCHSLLLTSGKFRWTVVHSVRQFHLFQCFTDSLFSFCCFDSLIQKRKLHIFLCRKLGQKIKILKDKPQLMIAYPDQFSF